MKKNIIVLLMITGLSWNACIASDKINPLVNKPYSSTLEEANNYLGRASRYFGKSQCKKCHRGFEHSIKISAATLIIELLKNKKSFQDIHPKIKEKLSFYKKNVKRQKETLYLGMYLANFAYGSGYFDLYGQGEGEEMEKSNINHAVVDLFIHEIKMHTKK